MSSAIRFAGDINKIYETWETDESESEGDESDSSVMETDAKVTLLFIATG